jgi:hypothetical protein
LLLYQIIQAPTTVFLPPAKKKIMDDIVDWIWSNNPNPDEIDEPTLQVIAMATLIHTPKEDLVVGRGTVKEPFDHLGCNP